jgi:hypothetical protein
MKLGAEPKKLGIFLALLAVAGIVYWMNSSSDAPPVQAVARPAADVSTGAVPAVEGINKPVERRSASGHPSLAERVYKRPDAVDPGKVDATLRLDLLAKVQSVELEGGARNLFQFCLDCAVREKQAADALAAKNAKVPAVDPIHPNVPQPTPPAAASTQAPPAAPPGPPPPPPINLKYYGYSTKRSDGEKKAFFLDGEDIIVAAEGEIIKKQYKVLRIGVTSVQMEDTASKSTQTLPIQQDAAPV